MRKRQATLKMTFSKPKGPSTDVEFEGVVEELRRDRQTYQKTAMLHLRSAPQSDRLVMNLTVHFIFKL